MRFVIRLGLLVLCTSSISCASGGNDEIDGSEPGYLVNLEPEQGTTVDLTLLDSQIRTSTEAVLRNPDNIQAYLDRGIAWHSKGEYDKAINDYNEVLGRDAKNHAARSQRAKAWYDKQRYDKAISDFDAAILLAPNDAELYNLRGFSRLSTGDYEKAVTDFTESLRLNPRAYTFSERGRAWTMKGEVDKAIADFNEAIRLDRENALPYLNRGTLFALKKDFKKAGSDLETALRLSPVLPEACSECAWFLATCPDPKFRDGKRAVELATRACEMTGWKGFRHISTLAAAYAESGDFGSAARWEQKSIELTPVQDSLYKPSVERLKLYKSNQAHRD